MWIGALSPSSVANRADRTVGPPIPSMRVDQPALLLSSLEHYIKRPLCQFSPQLLASINVPSAASVTPVALLVRAIALGDRRPRTSEIVVLRTTHQPIEPRKTPVTRIGALCRSPVAVRAGMAATNNNTVSGFD